MLKGRTALVTGAIDGLGFAMAKSLAASGCNIVLNGLAGADQASARRRELESEFGVKTLYHGADLRKPAEIGDLIKATLDQYGAVDILVNNAVVRHFAPIEQFETEHWDEALAVNLSAVFHAIRLVLPHMRERKFGRIINMTSAYGFFATPNRIDYVTTKTALIGLTRSVAIETVGQNITCNAVCPATVRTPAIESRIESLAKSEGISMDEAVTEYLAERQPSRQFIAPESVGALVVFLCGAQARDITGSVQPIDGGWLAS